MTRKTKEKGRRATKEKARALGKEKGKEESLRSPTRRRRTKGTKVPRRVPRARPRRLMSATTVARKGIGP